jgi:hypothetical protein
VQQALQVAQVLAASPVKAARQAVLELQAALVRPVVQLVPEAQAQVLAA